MTDEFELRACMAVLEKQLANCTARSVRQQKQIAILKAERDALRAELLKRRGK